MVIRDIGSNQKPLYISLKKHSSIIFLKRRIGMDNQDVVVILPDSGERTEFESGAVRDIQAGKGRCDLLPLDVVGAVIKAPELALIEEFKDTKDVNIGMAPQTLPRRSGRYPWGSEKNISYTAKRHGGTQS